MTIYPDTSFLASLYGADANSLEAIRQITPLKAPLALTPLGELEFVNAFESRISRKESTAAQVTAYSRALHDDIAAGIVSRVPFRPETLDRAIELARQHSRALSARSLDILHVALALEIGATVFLTFDVNQAKLARAAGLKVRP